MEPVVIPDSSIRALVRPSIVEGPRLSVKLQPGWSVDECLGHMVETGALSAHVLDMVGVWLVDQDAKTAEFVAYEDWRFVYPKPGQLVTVALIPQKGGGGGGKSPIKIIASLAIMAVGWYAGATFAASALGSSMAASINEFAAGTFLYGTGNIGGMLVSGVVSTAVGLVGNAVVGALVPTTSAANRDLTLGSSFAPTPISDPVFSITGLTNRANPLGPYPRVLGQRRMYPPLQALTYTETVGNDTYLRFLLTFGYGPLEIADIKIGETPIDAYPNVEYEVRQGFDTDEPVTLFTQSVHEESLSVALTGSSGWQRRTTRTGCNEIIIDYTCGRGLTKFESNGTRSARSVDVEARYRAVGATDWISLGTTTISDNSSSAVRASQRVTVGGGQYEVETRRVTADSTDAAIVDLVAWTALRSVTSEYPVGLTGLALIAGRIKGTDSLNGTIQTLNAVCTSMVPVWDGAAWSDPVACRIPAWLFCEVARGKANLRPYADSEIDLAGMLDWAAASTAMNPQGTGVMYTFDAVIDARTTVDALLREIAATGHARYYPIGTTISVVRERDTSALAPVWWFTPRNSSGFKARRGFSDLPHGLKCRWINPDAGWQEEETIVYADGYDANTATLFEQLDMLTVTRYEQVWIQARQHLAAAKLRPGDYDLQTDVEHLNVLQGDLVGVAYDVPLWGLQQFRLSAAGMNEAGDCTDVDLDAPVTMADGESYVLRIFMADGSAVLANVVTLAGQSTHLDFTAPIPLAAQMPGKGDLAMFGRVGQESVRLIAKDIRRGADLSATITFLNEAPEIQTSYAGTIPAFSSQISQPVRIERQKPARPCTADVRSDETVMVRGMDGTWLPRILVDLAPLSGSTVPVDHLEAQYKPSSSANWQTLPNLPANATEFSISGVTEGQAYDIRQRSVSIYGEPSDWFPTMGHVVVGKSSPPPDVPSMRLNPDGTLEWDYPSPPIDFWGFRVRHRPGTVKNWSDSVSAHAEDVITVQSLDISSLSGQRVVMAKAVDTSGNESAVSCALYLNLGDPAVDNIIYARDYAAESFPGDLTGGTLTGGVLAANDTGGLYLPSGSGLYLPTATDPYLPVTYAEMVWQAAFVPDLTDLPSSITLETGVTADSWDIQFRRYGSGAYLPNDTDPYLPDDAETYLGGAGAWAAWPGSLALSTRERIDFKLRLSAGDNQGTVSGFAVRLDVPTIEEELDDIVIFPGGTRLPTAKTWRRITNVQLTLQADGNGADSVRIEDKDVSGPLTKTFAVGSPVQGLVDARMKGY